MEKERERKETENLQKCNMHVLYVTQLNEKNKLGSLKISVQW